MLVKPSSGQLVRTLKDEKDIVFVYMLCVWVWVCKVEISGFYKHKHTQIVEVAIGEINFVVVLQGVV